MRVDVPAKTNGEVKENKNSVWYIARSLLAGGTAGATAKSVTAPLDRVKILLQVNSKHYPASSGIMRNFLSIPAKEGYLGYYKGNGAQIIRVFPYASIQFFAFERFKKLLMPEDRPKNKYMRLVAGSLAGLTSSVATYPLDLVRARLASQVDVVRYTGVFDCLRTVVRKEGGVRSLYAGVGTTLWGIMPYAGLSFFTFETLKESVAKHYGVEPSELGVVASLACGAVAGVAAQSAAYPIDVVRRRMQLQAVMSSKDEFGTRPVMRSTLGGLVTIYRREGLAALYRGLSLNYVRAVPTVAVSFTVYGQAKRFLGVE